MAALYLAEIGGPSWARGPVADCATLAEQNIGRWNWWNGMKPDRRNRTVMLNCYRWQAVWL